MLIYLLVAYYIARWRSGMLPVIAALATIMLIFAAVSAPEWFARDKEGFEDPALAASVLGPGHAPDHPGPGAADRASR